MLIAPADSQLDLFHQPKIINCTSMASARNAYGDAAQEIVYTLLGITPIRINGNYDYCFDGARGAEYFEIKSTRAGSGKVVVYDFRMDKERRADVKLTYLIVCHSLRGHREDILQAMAARPVVIYSVPASVVHQFAARCPLNHIRMQAHYTNRTGYSRAGYIEGYRNVSLKWLAEACEWTETAIENTIGTGNVLLRSFVAVDAAQ